MKIRFLIFCLTFFLLATAHLLQGLEYLGDEERQSGEITFFQIKIAADRHYIARSAKWYGEPDEYFNVPQNENWKGDLEDLINCANKRFDEQGIRVRLEIVEIMEWHVAEENATLRESLEDLVKKISSSDCDLVVALTAKSFTGKDEKGGFCDFRGYVLVRDFSPFFLKGNALVRENDDSWTLAMFLHEIGHYFLGPAHSNNSNSLMCGDWPGGIRQYFLEEEVEYINKVASTVKKEGKTKYKN